ncbi:MAG: TonB-dependent receptor, partial [Bacteroidales bacterium]|nr:TonB-dependent receptor [Bacteroidales bacterium]
YMNNQSFFKRLVLTALSLVVGTGVFAQSPIQGVVVDGQGAPVIGASVFVKGDSSKGAATDVDGVFSLAVHEGVTLVVSAIGFQSVEIPASSGMKVTLAEDTEFLDDVVVVGYGTQKKVNMTGAVGSIKSESINKFANSTTASMQGVSPGLTILDKGGAPGRANTTLRVRGITTINNSDALLLVDGVEQRISDVNPDDIESISILKDASTSAIYGSRAANGIVLITTKRAKEGDVRIDFNAYGGIHQVTNKPQHMGTVDYMRQQNEAFINNGANPRYSEAFINAWIQNHESDPVTYREANQWQNTVYHTGIEQNYALNVSGGTEKAKGMMSLRYNNKDGVIDNFNSDIKEIRVNTDFKPLPFLKLSADADFRSNYSLSPADAYDYDVAGGGIFYSMFHATQFVVPQYPDGTYGLGNKNASPLVLARMNGSDKQWDNLFIGSIKAEIDLFKDLKFTTQLSERYNFYKQVIFRNKYTVSDSNYLNWGSTASGKEYTPPTSARTRNVSRNSMDDYRRDINEYTLNLLLNYKHQFGKHGVEALFGFSQIENKWSHNEAKRYDFYNNDVQSINMGSKEGMESYGYDNAYALQSYFARANYNFDNRYLLEANIRYDGTSRFTGDNQFGVFPSFSAAWRISNEPFWEPLKGVINDLKIRASWGKTGNQTAGLYAFYESYSSTTYNFGGSVVQGYMQNAQANKEIKWETSTQTDVGIDAGFFNNRLTTTADYYYKKTDGILVSLPIASVIGLDAPVQNAAVVENKGFEFAVDWKDQAGDVFYTLNFNISNNWNKVLSLGGANPTLSGGASDVVTTVREGYPINAYWGYKTDGLLTQADIDAKYPVYDSRMRAGDVKYLDLNNDGSINSDDYDYIGNEFPRYPFAFGGTVAWKGFDFAMQWQGVIDASTRISGALTEGGAFEGFTLNLFTDHWTEDNTSARFPRPRKSVDYNNWMSDFWVISGKYLRLKSASIGYTLPASITRNVRIEKARFYIAGTNLLTFSPLKEWGVDPEFLSGRFLYYPQTSAYVLGINLTF